MVSLSPLTDGLKIDLPKLDLLYCKYCIAPPSEDIINPSPTNFCFLPCNQSCKVRIGIPRATAV